MMTPVMMMMMMMIWRRSRWAARCVQHRERHRLWRLRHRLQCYSAVWRTYGTPVTSSTRHTQWHRYKAWGEKGHRQISTLLGPFLLGNFRYPPKRPTNSIFCPRTTVILMNSLKMCDSRGKVNMCKDCSRWRRQLLGTGARAPLDFQIWEPAVQALCSLRD